MLLQCCHSTVTICIFLFAICDLHLRGLAGTALCSSDKQCPNRFKSHFELFPIENLNGVDDPVDVAAEFGILPGCRGMHK